MKSIYFSLMVILLAFIFLYPFWFIPNNIEIYPKFTHVAPPVFPKTEKCGSFPKLFDSYTCSAVIVNQHNQAVYSQGFWWNYTKSGQPKNSAFTVSGFSPLDEAAAMFPKYVIYVKERTNSELY